MSTDFFAQVFGHESVKRELKQALAKNSLPHAMLFSGPEAVGKRALAQALASEILGQASEQHPDLHVITHDQEKRDISVDSVRELINVLNLKPYMSSKSIAIIEDAHRLSLSGCNALLKTLEEPTGHSHLILVTSNAHRLPETILSRCQQLSFGLLSGADLKKVLGKILGETVKNYDLAFLNGSLEALELSPLFDRRSLKALDEKELAEHIQKTLGEYQAARQKIQTMLTKENSIAQAVSLATELAADFNERIIWDSFRAELKQELLKAKPARQAQLAKLIRQSALSEKLCAERSANLQLQLTPLLLDALKPIS